MNSACKIRDLTWAINSPSLLSGGPAIKYLDPGEVDPEHLVAFLDQSSGHRVGRYFERLVLYWLTHIRKVEVVAESLQIRDGKRTVGEIDLIFRDEEGRMTHWEIAVKFYLYHRYEHPIGSHYIGPGAADTFERKMDRLFGHQLPISKLHFPAVEIRQAFFKGRIFYHPDGTQPSELPQRLSPEHLRCTWLRSSQMELIRKASEVSYRILRKPHWLSQVTTGDQERSSLTPTDLVQQLSKHFSDNDRPVLVSQIEGLIETGRIFVVPDHWPNLSAEY